MKRVVLLLLHFYKKTISPFLVAIFGQSCRFTPTCSEYTIEAVDRFGVFKGLYKGTNRLLKCHPYNKGGFDPVK